MPQRLDSPEFVRKNDPRGMFDYVLGFPEQCREALSIAEAFPFQESLFGCKQVLIAGVGGSAAGGDFLRALFEERSHVPCAVVRDYQLPAFAGPETLVIACSYSGNTEETLSAVQDAKKRACKILAVTSGRKLADIGGFPVITIPGGQPPRSALGYLFVPLAVAAVKCGYLPQLDFSSAFNLLDECAAEWNVDKPHQMNPTKMLATYLLGAVPLIYGLGVWQGIVASRWKSQLNENSKIMAFANSFPELNHNEIMGWQLAHKQNVAKWATVILESGEESKRMQTRAQVTREIMQGKSESLSVTARGESLLSKMLTLTYFGDFASVYLASLYEVDPESIDAINTLKKALAEAR